MIRLCKTRDAAKRCLDSAEPQLKVPLYERKRSLLSKTFMQFVGCTVVCFVLTAPLFYLLTKYFYAEDMIDIIESVEHGKGIPPLDLERDIMAGMFLQFLMIFLAISLSLTVTMRFVTKRL